MIQNYKVFTFYSITKLYFLEEEKKMMITTINIFQSFFSLVFFNVKGTDRPSSKKLKLVGKSVETWYVQRRAWTIKVRTTSIIRQELSNCNSNLVSESTTRLVSRNTCRNRILPSWCLKWSIARNKGGRKTHPFKIKHTEAWESDSTKMLQYPLSHAILMPWEIAHNSAWTVEHPMSCLENPKRNAPLSFLIAPPIVNNRTFCSHIISVEFNHMNQLMLQCLVIFYIKLNDKSCISKSLLIVCIVVFFSTSNNWIIYPPLFD